MTEVKPEALWVVVGLTAAILPVTSALTTKRAYGNFAKRWMICLIANSAVFVLVWLGFSFEGVVDYLIFGGDPYFPVHFTWWQKAEIYLRSQFSAEVAKGLAGIALISLIVTWGTLFGKNRHEWAIYGCRSAFVMYAMVDIVLVIVRDSSILYLIENLLFDLVGAMLFGAAASVLISVIFGEMKLIQRPVVAA